MAAPSAAKPSLWWPRRPLATLGRKSRQGRKAATVSIDAGAEVSRRGRHLFGPWKVPPLMKRWLLLVRVVARVSAAHPGLWVGRDFCRTIDWVAGHELAFYWLRVNRHASRVRCAYPGYVASEGSDVADRGWLRPSPHPNPRSAPRPSRCRECAPRVANRWSASAPSRPAGGRGARISLLLSC